MIDRVYRTLAEVHTTRHIFPELFDLRLDSIHIDIADNDDRLVVRSVPFMVVVAQRLILEVIDHGRVADHVALCILRTWVHLRVQFFPDTTLRRTTRTPLLQNDTALGIDLFRKQ